MQRAEVELLGTSRIFENYRNYQEISRRGRKLELSGNLMQRAEAGTIGNSWNYWELLGKLLWRVKRLTQSLETHAGGFHGVDWS